MKIVKFITIFLVIIFTTIIIFFYEEDIPKDVVDAKYANHASQFLDLGKDGLIHYRDQGDRRAQVIVLLHGSNASLHTWEPWVEQLSNSYRLISLDFPAHGLTGAVPSGEYSTASYLSVVERILDNLSVDTFVIAGNSMGGGIAWRFALKHPEKVEALVLVAASGLSIWRTIDAETAKNRFEEAASAQNSILAFRLLGMPWFRAIGAKLDPYYLIIQGLKSAYNYSEVVDDDLVMRYYNLHLRDGTRTATLSRFSQPRIQRSFNLSQISAPTLLMWGEQDPLNSMQVARRFEESIPNTRTAYYADVGHVPMEEIPKRSADDLQLFLSSVSGSRLIRNQSAMSPMSKDL
ncbi:MAG: hypothetical protein CMP89_03715 [Gammaproteobacteria bacterium]|nr:hypothetical protein [Gammaproteobacteria bacterium]